MKVAVFGLGYVGFTALCCIAKEGHLVIGFDVSEKKVQQIKSGICPIAEPLLPEMLMAGLAGGQIDAYSDIGDRLGDIDLAIVCVGTPSGSDGAHNMTYIAEVTRQIAAAVDDSAGRATPLTVAYRSTIRPGTMQSLIEPIFRAELGERFESLIELVYNPEFLREATAVNDYFAPPKIVIGTRNGEPNVHMNELNKNIEAPTFHVGFGEAEMTKFVDNTWHAVKVAYANEIGRVCLQLGLSAATVSKIFLSDTKLNISAYYMRPGGAFGGSCLPKDVRALQYISADVGAHTHLIDSLLRSNEAHKYRLFQHVTGDLAPGASVLLVGLAFKAHTDDLRESPNVDLARNLLREGYELKIFDPSIDAGKLVGANLGYAYTQIPQLKSLLVSAAAVDPKSFDRVIVTNATGKLLDLGGASVVDISALS